MSAVLASPAAKESDMDSVRALQHALYRAAKADPGRRFHSLWDKILRRDVLERAWEDVRRNGGAAGIDRITITDVEEYGVSRLLDEVAAALREGRWRPLPGPPGLHSQARVVGAETALDSFGRGPGCAGCGEDRARAGLRGRHVGVFVRVPPKTRRARRSAGAR